MTLATPIMWFGGKGMHAPKIVPFLPPHTVYVEPFGGGASVLLAKGPSAVEVYNDLDSGLVGFWRVLRDPEQFPRFLQLVSLTPYSREEFLHCRDTWEATNDPVERAYRWFIVARMSFSGGFGGGGWSHSVGMSRRMMAGAVSRYLNAIEWLPEIHCRMMRVQIEHQDFREVLRRYDTPDTLFYCDPPYTHDTRGDHRYAVEMNGTDQEEMVALLTRLKGKVVLSGYPNPLYRDRLELACKWERNDFLTSCFAAGRTSKTGIQGEGAAKESQARTESLWLSPSARQQKTLVFDE